MCVSAAVAANERSLPLRCLFSRDGDGGGGGRGVCFINTPHPWLSLVFPFAASVFVLFYAGRRGVAPGEEGEERGEGRGGEA